MTRIENGLKRKKRYLILSFLNNKQKGDILFGIQPLSLSDLNKDKVLILLLVYVRQGPCLSLWIGGRQCYMFDEGLDAKYIIFFSFKLLNYCYYYYYYCLSDVLFCSLCLSDLLLLLVYVPLDVWRQIDSRCFLNGATPFIGNIYI